MIPIYNNSVIYVACPAQTFSGGPELLHQLVHKLSLQGYNAYMVYYPDMSSPVHSNLKNYDNKYTTNIDDKYENILILPETMVSFGNRYSKIRKCLWWLSVDNFFKQYLISPKGKILRKIGLKELYKRILFKVLVSGRFQFHLAQSFYAYNFLKQRKTKSEYLSDYLNPVFLSNINREDVVHKKKQVLYNPKKGYEFTKKIMAAESNIKWIPLSNMSPNEIAKLLRESMIYIDFGTHPGKDRFPREAVINDCCIITNKRGSASYYEDVPIPDRYKIKDREKNIPLVLDRIHDCLNNFCKNLEDFKLYKEEVLSEEDLFTKDLGSIFPRDTPNCCDY